MKILMLTRLYFPHIGGVEEHVQKISRELIKKNHQVTILTTKHQPDLPDQETQAQIKILRVPYCYNKITLWQNMLKHYPFFQKADIIHCHDVTWWTIPIKPFLKNKKIITTFHGWEGLFPIPQKNILSHKLAENLSLQTICVGHYLKIWYHHQPDLITYGAVEKTKPNPQPQSFKKAVFIGRLQPDLGLDKYIKAFKTLKNQNFKITFIGDGPYKSKLKKIGQVTGFVKDIKPYLKKADLVFASSYLTILKAMAYQKPVFALYQNSLKKDYLTFFPAAKYLNISSSASQLISQIKKLQKNPQIFQTKIQKAYQYAQKQTWSKLASQYLKLYQS